MSNNTTTIILDTQSDYTSIRIHRNTIEKLDRIGTEPRSLHSRPAS